MVIIYRHLEGKGVGNLSNWCAYGIAYVGFHTLEDSKHPDLPCFLAGKLEYEYSIMTRLENLTLEDIPRYSPELRSMDLIWTDIKEYQVPAEEEEDWTPDELPRNRWDELSD